MELTAEDEEYLLQGEAFRLRLSKPVQSGFRVVALVVYVSTSGESCLTFGANDEPCHISGSICAERSAFLQLRLVPVAEVVAIYILSDADYPIPPGMLCREYMRSSLYVDPTVPIIMSASGFQSLQESRSKVTKLPLAALYPHASIFAQKGVEFATSMHDSLMTGSVTLQSPQGLVEKKVYAAAKEIALFDDRKQVHPMQYGAAVICSDGHVLTAFEKKGVEYGCTLCAVTQLAQAVEDHLRNNEAVTLNVLAQVDAAGICHAPFAAARSWLAEFGHDTCRVLVHELTTDKLSLKETTVAELCPLKDLPIFSKEG